MIHAMSVKITNILISPETLVDIGPFAGDFLDILKGCEEEWAAIEDEPAVLLNADTLEGDHTLVLHKSRHEPLVLEAALYNDKGSQVFRMAVELVDPDQFVTMLAIYIDMPRDFQEFVAVKAEAILAASVVQGKGGNEVSSSCPARQFSKPDRFFN